MKRTSTPSPAVRPVPSPDARPAIVASLLALVVAGLLAVFPDPDPDIWWHLKTGEVIVTQQTIPRTDPFTYTAEGRPWVTHEWLTEVILYSVHRAGGVNLLLALKALLVLAALGLGAWAALVGDRPRDRLAPTALGLLLAAPLLATRAFARPHLFTAVLLAATLLLLRLESATGSPRPRRRYRLALIPLFILWANLHSGFVLGLALVALYWIGEAFGDRPTRLVDSRSHLLTRDRRLFFVLLAAVTLLNPNHVHAFLYPFQLIARPEVRRGIVELRPIFHPDYRGALFLTDLLVLALLLGVILVGSGRRVVWALLLPGLAFGLMGIRAVRGVTELAVLVPALIGLHGAWLGRRRGGALGLPAIVIILSAALAVAALRGGIPMGREGTRRAGLGISQTMVPDQAALFLRQADVEGRLFNLLGFGGYLIHQLWPERQVYIDGRLDVFPPGFLDAYGRMLTTGEGWDEACREYGITLAIVDQRPGPAGDFGLRRRLRTDPEWSCVFLSHNALVYARHVPSNRALLDRFGSPLDPSLLSVDSIRAFVEKAPPAELTQAIGAMTAMAEVARRDKFLLVALGQLLDAAGRSAEGVEWMRQAIQLDPTSLDARLLLAATLLRAEKLVEAEGEITGLLNSAPRRVEPLLLLADLHQRRGDLPAARAAVEAARAIQPDHPAVRRGLDLLRRLEEN